VRALDVVRSTDPPTSSPSGPGRHAHRPRRHRRHDGGGHRRRARRASRRTSRRSRPSRRCRSPRGPGVPRGAARRLPPALHVERRRRPDRGDGGHGDRARPRVHGADRPLRPPHRRPRPERGAPGDQLDEIAAVNADIAAAGHDFRILSGMEVDILEDGRSTSPTSAGAPRRRRGQRPLEAADGTPPADDRAHADGGRQRPRRHPRALHRPDDRQAPAVAVRRRLRVRGVRQFGTAVEINCRPERLDPPRELLDVAIEHGCWFSIDSDAHATGQLEWQPQGFRLRPRRRARRADRADRQHADVAGFHYTRYPDGDEYHRTVHHHTIGADWRDDPVVWAEHPTPQTWPQVEASPDGRFLLVAGDGRLGPLRRPPARSRHAASGAPSSRVSRRSPASCSRTTRR
jgi:hypothetical protein